MALRQDMRCTPQKKMDCKKLKWVMSLVLGMGLLQDTAADVSLTGLPGTVELEENTPASMEVFTFEVSFSPGASVASGYPQILNTNPLTRAFIVSMVSASTAQVTVTGTLRLDFEMAPNSFVLQILVVDSAGDAVLGTLTVLLIDVDEAPVFLDEDSVIYTLEKSPPGVIYQPSVSDPENKPLTYALTPSNPAFSVDRDKGSLITTKPIDYETDPRSYSLNLTVSDGTHTAVRTLTVLIINANDDKPQFLNKITAFSIPEELNPGHILTNITAVVPNDTFYIGYILYTISTNSYLAIHTCESFPVQVPNRTLLCYEVYNVPAKPTSLVDDMACSYSGVVTIANRMDRDSNPLRDDPTVTVTVTATYSPPGPPLSHSIELTVTVTDINDNPPICSPDVQRRAVTETEALGALITMVTCQDNDVDPVFRKYCFTRLSCLGCNQLFTLSPTGSITLNGNLDFEDPNNLYAGNQYSLLVEAADMNDTFLTGNAYIDVTVTPVNEYPPVFTPSSYFYKISELLGRGAVIGQVNATDRDFPATGITYSFISGGGTSDLSNIFHLDPEHGTISLLTRPDYEATQTYQLVIRAVDGDPVKPLSATATVIVNITEANDEPPACGPNNTNLIVPVDLRPGSNVQSFILTCMDKDSPPTSFIYTISGASNLNGHFVFSPAAGTNVTRLILKEPFDFSGGRDTVWKYRLTVLVSDANLMAGEPPPRDEPQTGTVVINVQVFDPDLTTTMTTTTTPRITYIAVRENTFDVDDWYVTFICVLAALLLLGILGYLLYLCWKYLSTVDCSCCEPQPVEDKETLVPSVPEKALIQREIITEITKICTVFDGEAADPVTGRIYEYNTKSGARRWKDDTTESKPEIIQLKSSTVVSPKERANPESTSDTAQLQTTRGTVRSGTGQSQKRSNTNQSNHGSPQPNPRSQSRQQSSQSTARPRSRDIHMATLEAVDLSEV